MSISFFSLSFFLLSLTLSSISFHLPLSQISFTVFLSSVTPITTTLSLSPFLSPIYRRHSFSYLHLSPLSISLSHTHTHFPLQSSSAFFVDHGTLVSPVWDFWTRVPLSVPANQSSGWSKWRNWSSSRKDFFFSIARITKTFEGKMEIQEKNLPTMPAGFVNESIVHL